MKIYWSIDWHVWALLPGITIQSVMCENPHCGESHGWAVNVGWLSFGATCHFAPHDPEGHL